MKLNQEEMYAALGLLCRKIEACGASPAATDAVILADNIRQSVGNQWNPANGFSAKAVRVEIGGPIQVDVSWVPEKAPQQLTTVAKSFRKFLDDVLQRMKAHRDMLTTPGILIDGVEDQREMVANHILSLRHVEDAIMRQGMALKCIGATPNPYPQSYNPESRAIEPTADGLKL